MFDKTLKFVEDTRYLCTIIQNEEFYKRNGFFHQQAMARYESYCNVNERELVKEVNSSPLQTCFDDYKRLLNSIDIPNADTLTMIRLVEELTPDIELQEDAVRIFEGVVETCGNLRVAVEGLMELYGLKDNYPKKGFLCPAYTDDNYSGGRRDDEEDDPGQWFLEGKEKFQRFTLNNVNLRRLYDLLIDKELGIMCAQVTFEYFVDVAQRAQFGRIYAHCDTKLAKFRMVVTFLARHTVDKDKKREYMAAAATSIAEVIGDATFGADKLGKFNVEKTDKFRRKIEETL